MTNSPLITSSYAGRRVFLYTACLWRSLATMPKRRRRDCTCCMSCKDTEE